jgi:hypothetical protein
MSDHRWSGWPGAYCLDCFAEDQTEICVAMHDVENCEEHKNGPCPGPNTAKRLEKLHEDDG